jgi:hypothetical protein
MIKIINSILSLIFMGALIISCASESGEQNFEDLKKVQQGMKITQVHEIMKNPALSIEDARWSDSLIVEEYESSFGASDYYKIIYLKVDSTVVEIQWGD